MILKTTPISITENKHTACAILREFDYSLIACTTPTPLIGTFRSVDS
jgi:hypothetical protein